MPRPRTTRRVRYSPVSTYFKPAGMMAGALEQVIITIDELEAIRLVDAEEMSQTDAAEKMGISQSTLNRLLISVRKKIAEAIVGGKAILIEGGNFQMVGRAKQRAGGPTKCLCPSCNYEKPHTKGMPCSSETCPKCGARMIGKWERCVK